MGNPLMFAAAMLSAGCGAEDPEIPQLREQYRVAMISGDYEQAVRTADRLIELRPAFGWGARAHARAGQGRSTDAAADFTKALEVDPKQADLFRWRGRELFKLGKFDDAIADFDRLAKAKPETEAGLWERGLAYYYSARFVESVRQFTAYDTVDKLDIENGLWHFLSGAKIEGVEKARGNLLGYVQKKRPPFPELLALFSGKGKAQDVLKSAEDGVTNKAQLRMNRFFAHYYLGKWFDAHDKRDEAMTHFKLAVGNEITMREFASGNFMWHCARIDLERLEKRPK